VRPAVVLPVIVAGIVADGIVGAVASHGSGGGRAESERCDRGHCGQRTG
jgi:hypothetical protein